MLLTMEYQATHPINRFRLSVLTILSLILLSGCKSSAPTEANSKTFTVYSGTEKLEITEKTEPAMNFFYAEHTLSPEALKQKTKNIAEQVATTAVKRAKLDIVGPLMLIFNDLQSMSEEQITAAIGFPVKGRGNKQPPFALTKKPPFKCLSMPVNDPQQDSKAHWVNLHQIAEKRGYQLSGENRTVILPVGISYKTELQLGIL